MLLRKIEGGPTGRLCDTLMIAESANFKKHPLLVPPLLSQHPKKKVTQVYDHNYCVGS